MDSMYEKKIEDLMQENHHLKSLVEELKAKEEWYKEEITQLEQNTSLIGNSKQEKEFKAKELEFKEKVNSLRRDLEAAQQSEKQQQEKITELELVILENQKFSSGCDVTKVDPEETMGFSKDEQITELFGQINELQQQMAEDKAEVLKKQGEMEKLKSAMVSMEQELVSVKTECTSYSNLLEKARTENLELNTQLDVLLMQQEEQTHEKKGNSLFSEVDDKRVQAEKVLMSQKKTFDTMKQRCEVLKQHNQKLKMQLFAAMGRGNDDSDRVKQLEYQLEQERSDRQQLLEKVHQLEDQKAKDNLTEKLTEFTNKMGDGKGVDKDYVEYLANMLKTKEEEIEELSRKLHIRSMCLLDQKNKVSEKEKLLYTAEAKRDEMYRHYLQMKMERDEMEMELKPEIKQAKKPVGKTEQIPLGMEGVQERNVSILQETHTDNYKPLDREWGMQVLKEYEEEKRSKTRSRAVRMSDDVDVVFADGQMDTTSLKDNENQAPLVREKPAPGKVTKCVRKASEPKYHVDDCNTQ